MPWACQLFTIFCLSCPYSGWYICNEARDIIDPATPPPLCFKQSSNDNDWTSYCNWLEFETTQFLFSQEEMLVKKINTLLHLWGTSLAVHSSAPTFANHQDLYNTIDVTPLEDVSWSSHSIGYAGDRSDGTAPWMDNSDFKNEIDYTPYYEWEEHSSGTYNCHWHNLMSADWAWDQAVKILDFINVHHVHCNAVVLIGFLTIAKTTKKYSNDACF
ncbi:hypothetical protein HD554DRAFT_2040576 [Boletus coccyginus]|nr:hypothetical protein HD554DRAFT_2040576 [Boletus coccyginus]